MNLPKPPPWVDKALCAEVCADEWFPEPEATSTSTARAICARCEVRLDCLNYALDNNEPYGVWGGFGPAERRRLRRSVDAA